MAKKVAKILQLDESQVLVHPDGDVAQQESLPFDAAIEDAQQPVKAQETKAAKEEKVNAPENKPVAQESNQETTKPATPAASKPMKVSLENLQSGGQMDTSTPKTKRSRGGLISILLLILVAGGLYSSKDDIIALFKPPAAVPQAVVVEGAAPQDPKEEGANPANPANQATPTSPASPATPSAPSSAAPAAASVAVVAPLSLIHI